MIHIKENQQTILVGQQLGLYQETITDNFWSLQLPYPRYLREQSLVTCTERGCKHIVQERVLTEEWKRVLQGLN